jgi:hypothetical protein
VKTSFFKWNGGKTAESTMNKGIEWILNLLTKGLKLTSFEVCGWDDPIAFSQLRAITRPDLGNTPELVFNAINGLRHVLASFFRCAPVNREYITKNEPINWRAI